MGEANINKGDEMWDDERVKEEIKLGRLLVILDENVYDCSRFANIHPGGRNYIEQYCGRQMHNVMYNGPHEHSFNAYQLMKDYYCGKLAKTSRYLPLQKKKDVDKMTVDNTSQQTCSSEIDWSKPVLWQVYKLGANYNQWVHTPVDKPLRLFKSDFAEFFSKTPWFVIPIFWIPVILFASFRSILTFTESTPQWSGFDVLEMFILYFIAGVVTWTILEYALHRFLFHLEPSPKYPMLVTFHFLLHGQHHKVPFDSGRLVFPPAVASILAVCYYIIIGFCLEVGKAQALFAGTVLGYVCYDLIHYYLHYGKPSFSYFKMLKVYHVKHHFEDKDRGFGISSPIWDMPFGTQLDLTNKE